MHIDITIKNNKEVKIIVSDNGIGLTHEFNQSSNSFGLDLINSFVEDLGGQIQFLNDEGTTVEVILTDLDSN